MSTLGFLKGTHGLLLGAGVLIGSVGAKVLTSDGAKRVYVEAVAAGLRAKQACEDTVERAPRRDGRHRRRSRVSQ